MLVKVRKAHLTLKPGSRRLYSGFLFMYLQSIVLSLTLKKRTTVEPTKAVTKGAGGRALILDICSSRDNVRVLFSRKSRGDNPTGKGTPSFQSQKVLPSPSCSSLIQLQCNLRNQVGQLWGGDCARAQDLCSLSAILPDWPWGTAQAGACLIPVEGGTELSQSWPSEAPPCASWEA